MFDGVELGQVDAGLLAGRFEEGWPDYELRFISEDAPKRCLTLPRWDGQTLPDGAVLITAEQGLGDEIMFASCIPDLLAPERLGLGSLLPLTGRHRYEITHTATIGAVVGPGHAVPLTAEPRQAARS